MRLLPVLGVAALLLAACSTEGDDYYTHDPYQDDRVIDRGLVRAQDDFVRALGARDTTTIRSDMTAPPYADSMARFVKNHAGHPVKTTGRHPADGPNADQDLAVTCSLGRTQQVTIAWAWFDGAWRAWPADQDKPYPGC